MVYKIALFTHILGAFILGSCLSVEWFLVKSIRKAESINNLNETFANYSKLNILSGLDLILILVPGLYMMDKSWHQGGWMVIGFLGLLLIGLTGGILTGRKIGSIKVLLKDNNNASIKSSELINGNSLRSSIEMRASVFVGIILIMTFKFEMTGSLITLIVFIVIGFIPIIFKTLKSRN